MSGPDRIDPEDRARRYIARLKAKFPCDQAISVVCWPARASTAEYSPRPQPRSTVATQSIVSSTSTGDEQTARTCADSPRREPDPHGSEGRRTTGPP
jgi:hypothetical protein